MGPSSMQFTRSIGSGPGFGVIHGAELDAVHSSDRIRAGIHRATHTGAGCSCDPLRAVVSRTGRAHRAVSKLTYPRLFGVGCAKKPIDSSPSGRTPPRGQGEPLERPQNSPNFLPVLWGRRLASKDSDSKGSDFSQPVRIDCDE